METDELRQRAPAARQPMACTLQARDQQARLQQWHELRREALLEKQRAGRVLTTLWDRRGDAGARLKALIEAEKQCCAFLDFEIEELDHVIRVRTLFPPGAEALLESFMQEPAR